MRDYSKIIYTLNHGTAEEKDKAFDDLLRYDEEYRDSLENTG